MERQLDFGSKTELYMQKGIVFCSSMGQFGKGKFAGVSWHSLWRASRDISHLSNGARALLLAVHARGCGALCSNICVVCQQDKVEPHHPHDLLSPLPIWECYSMDFIVSLPPSWGCPNILVIVDRLSKYAVFVPTPKECTACQTLYKACCQIFGTAYINNKR